MERREPYAVFGGEPAGRSNPTILLHGGPNLPLPRPCSEQLQQRLHAFYSKQRFPAHALPQLRWGHYLERRRGRHLQQCPPSSASDAALNSTGSKVLIEVKDVGHLTIAGVGSGAQMEEVISQISGVLPASIRPILSDPPGRGGSSAEPEVPTWSYAIAFLNGILGVPGAPEGMPSRAPGESTADVLQALTEAAADDPSISNVFQEISAEN